MTLLTVLSSLRTNNLKGRGATLTYDLAIRAFDEAIRLKPDYGEAFANRATAYLKKKAYDHAARDFDERSE
jgi:tetratricopeptide (TPR) repeat protein